MTEFLASNYVVFSYAAVVGLGIIGICCLLRWLNGDGSMISFFLCFVVAAGLFCLAQFKFVPQYNTAKTYTSDTEEIEHISVYVVPTNMFSSSSAYHITYTVDGEKQTVDVPVYKTVYNDLEVGEEPVVKITKNGFGFIRDKEIHIAQDKSIDDYISEKY